MTDEPLDYPSPAKFVPVCAMGASAGGVAALQAFFRLLPTDLGLAYVVILHLNPDEPSALADILAVCTRMPVHQVQDGLPLRRNCVYVIPPERELAIDGDNVIARPFTEPRGQRATIDMFFRSVAAGRGDGVAIVLSGAGSDGALGVSAIKEAGGIIMVQEPAEATFATMPQSAIATGMADFVGPVASLAERLVEVARSKEAVRSLDMDDAANDLRRVIALLRARAGHDFSAYKRATVMRRVLRRMQVCRNVTLAGYADYLLATPEEAQNLFVDLLISVTMFFRDEAAFDALARQAIKPIVEEANAAAHESIRVWVVGCASGEEAYSVAILLHEEMSRQKAAIPIQIFATDLDEGALATAREGRYPRSIVADVSEERLARFFIDEGMYFRVRKELRESVLFAKHSILKEPPFMRLDLISCRNLLIYLERAVQGQLCSLFHYGLRPGQYLFLGSAETVDAATDQFAPVDRHARIYSSRPHRDHPLPMLPQFAAPREVGNLNRAASIGAEPSGLAMGLHIQALESNAPPSVLVDDRHNILHLSSTAGRYLLLPGGPVTTALPALVRSELRLGLRLALTRALAQRQPTVTSPTVVAFDQDRRRVAVQIVPVADEAQKAAQALVFFLDGGALLEGEEAEPPPQGREDDVRNLHAELKASQDALIISRREHDAAVQELRAANEELQSINEEQRSTAEELETSKEELQSINEELQTVNAELKSKLDTLSRAHSDLQNLTAATEIGTLFLDAELRIKMFTPPVARLFNIINRDVGRVITDLTHHLDYDEIEEDARKVLQDLTPIEREVNSRSGERYVMRLRPYRTVENRIDGTVVTFFDVSQRVRAEAALRESEARYRALFESMDEAYAVVEVLKDEAGKWSDFRFIDANPAFVEHTAMPWPVGKTAKELLGTPNPRWTQLYGEALDTGTPIRVEEEERTLDRTFDLNIFTLDRDRNRVAVLFTNITERKKGEAALRESEGRLRAVIQQAPLAIAFTGASGEILFRNSMFDQLWGRPARETTVRTYSDMYEGYHLDGRPVASEEWAGARALLKGEVVKDEIVEIVHANGTRIPCWFAAAPIVDATGRTMGAVVLFRDVSEERRAQEALRESEEIRRIALEGGGMGAWTWDTRERSVRADEAFQRLWGVSFDARHPVSTYTDLMYPEGAAALEAVMAKDIAPGEAFHDIVQIASGPTASRWIHWRGRAERDRPWIINGVSFDVTEQRLAEQKVRRSEAQLRGVLDSMAEGFALFSQDFTIIDVNEETLRLDGRSRNELVGRSHWEAFPGTENSPLGELLRQVARDRVPGSLEHQYEWPDGRALWLDARAYPIQDGGVAIFWRDVTERRAAADALRESEERFRLIVESARDYAIFTIDDAGIITSWPAGAAKVFGWSEAEMLGQPIERTFVPEDVAAGEPAKEREAACRDGVGPDVREHLRKDGRRIFIDGFTRPFTTRGKVHGFIKVGQDISERRAAEIALRESEERFRQFGDASRDILWMRDAKTLQWVYLSSAFDGIYGFPREQALGGDTFDRWLELILPEDREHARQNIQRLASGETGVFEFRIRRRSDEAIRWIRDTDFPLLDAQGRVQRIGGIARDVTEEKETAERLKVLVLELQHRTRNLMGVVRSVADRTLASADSLENFKENFRARLGALARVNGLLSRLNEHDRITLDELIRTELSGHGVVPGNDYDGQVTLDGPEGIRLRSATVQVFALALHELATNALKYGALSDPNGHLEVRWRLIVDGEARLRVEWRETGVTIDVGNGVPARSGYGRELIERALPFQLQAETSFDLGPDGVRCTITLPISTQHGASEDA